MAENTTQRQVILDFDLNAAGALKPGYKKPRSCKTGLNGCVISTIVLLSLAHFANLSNVPQPFVSFQSVVSLLLHLQLQLFDLALLLFVALLSLFAIASISSGESIQPYD
ncbi:hypothetical protein [uncultured Alistipes sp.]|uniref:hypothetical protein n=1 Tax=uncultured Alistipes sp. TaxID=538949 RepID=UPI00259678F1|nr:hypothetical protein [uncultured Alistipes sp.]